MHSITKMQVDAYEKRSDPEHAALRQDLVPPAIGSEQRGSGATVGIKQYNDDDIIDVMFVYTPGE
jgi:hypothetical protein